MIKVRTGTDSQILSVGGYQPARVVPNSEIVDRIDSTDEWIQQRTGIESRRFAAPDESVIDMATKACQQALDRAHLTMADIDTVIVATITYPFQAPSAATALVARLGNPKAAAFDINAACAGFCYGLGMASDFVRSGTSKHVLVVGVEKLSDFTDPDDRATAFIFADGAGAVIVGPSDHPGIGPTVWGSDADSRDAIVMNPSWNEFRNDAQGVKWPNISQQGQAVFRWAVFSMSKAGVRALEAAGVTPDQLDAFIPHQANVRIIETMAKEMKIPEKVIIAQDIRTSGNTSAASVPLAMSALLAEHPELHGGLALLIGYGAGLVYA
ncbi:MAG: beta-ketoacyl-ACP synthase III, partial [Actinobacteria bacterium]|nr:beta-ketoacyl-ACP synthase III [Actinomycetota bacterium]MSV87292.1 beta-ketoacyl-ACP synthase III [Actinomycetota bacterium]MSY20716.1 beta-ketoacyl-ACP synthase III [Actinomycetota bacterium]MSZ85964.1 beta-ketoacyl-ACP synthase III [Actinomycetota bacterium]